MKKDFIARTLTTLVLLIIIVSQQIIAQRPVRAQDQVAVIRWTDDSHFLIRRFDQDKKSYIDSVNVKTGKAIKVTERKSPAEIFRESLPSGIELGSDDIINPDMKSAILTKDNDLWLFRSGDAQLTRLTDNKEPELNARLSPEGTKIAYTRKNDLYIYDLINRREIRITSDGSDRIYNGYAAWVYFEEILGRASRYAAFWWSPDGSKIAFLRFDETEVPLFTLNRLDESDGIHGTLEVVPYPKPGDPNPKVKMGIADLNAAKTTWVKTDESVDQYLAWPFWTPDSRKLAIQVLNRDQTILNIILADPATGEFSQVFEESWKTWIEFHEDIYVMNDNSGFIIRSFKNGWDNLYYIGWDGTQKVQLTNYEFRVTSIDRVDEKKRVVYFYATGEESTQNHLFRVGLDGKKQIQLTSGEGTHRAMISPGGSYFIDTWNSIKSPGSIVSFDSKGKLIREIHAFEQPVFNPAEHSRQEFIKIKTSDGLFDMPAIVTYPLNFDPTKKYPVVFTIYGGPDSKNIYDRWQGTTPSWYSRNGIITFTVDHRGSGQFGRRGLDYLHRSLGKWEILDYSDAVRWLRQKPFVDSTRMGITGSSYGGYMTCMALTKGAEFWTHGNAGSSVTDWKLYDNVYTERFMDTPQDNPEGYKEGSALTFAGQLKGKLYMTHGDMDDNVHMQNTIQLISKLQDAGKRFSFMLYPNGRHGWGGEKAIHARNETYEFWLDSFFRK